jgi:hypothetical protein
MRPKIVSKFKKDHSPALRMIFWVNKKNPGGPSGPKNTKDIKFSQQFAGFPGKDIYSGIMIVNLNIRCFE